VSPEHIEATGNALSRFGIIELIILGIIGVIILVIIVLGKRLIDVWMAKINKDSQQMLISLNKENNQIEVETNAFVKEIVDRLTPIEENITSLQKKTDIDNQDIEKIKKLLAENVAERMERQSKFDNELDSIKSSMKNIFSILSDHEEFQEKISEGTLENILFNENISVFKRLKSFLRLIAMKKNGRIKEKGFKTIMDNKDTWLTILEILPTLNLHLLDQKYFDSVLDEINHRIFDRMMW